MTNCDCYFCCTPIKLKGLIMSGLLVGCAIATSALTFTTDCQKVITFADNQTTTINDIGTANKVVSMSLLSFSIASALFERYINKKLLKTEEENDELKTQNNELKTIIGSNRNSYEYNNEPQNILSTPSPITPNIDTNRSSETNYPPALNFGRR